MVNLIGYKISWNNDIVWKKREIVHVRILNQFREETGEGALGPWGQCCVHGGNIRRWVISQFLHRFSFYPAVRTGSSNTRFYPAVRTGSSNTRFSYFPFFGWSLAPDLRFLLGQTYSSRLLLHRLERVSWVTIISLTPRGEGGTAG